MKLLRLLPFALAGMAPLASQACAVEPYIGSICVMAWPKTSNFGGNVYTQANGAQMALQSYQALYAVIGVTYGGDGRTNFKLPDLRGRTIIGAGQGQDQFNYVYGQTGGVSAITLTPSQMPAHAHDVGTAKVTVSMSGLTANSTLTGLTATTTLGNLAGSVAGSSFSLNANGGNGGVSAASGAALATANGPSAKIYATSAPNVAMAAGSIGGNANVAFTGSPSTTLSGGTVSTTLNGSPAAVLSGTTSVAGGNSGFTNMQPYMPMTIYIAYGGLFPTVD